MTALFGQLGSLGAIVGGSVGRLVISGMILAMGVTTVVTVGTGALFTDTQSVGANDFTTGTLDIASLPGLAFSVCTCGSASRGTWTASCQAPSG